MTPESPALILGERYAVGPVLGRGGMGEVRAGHDLRLGRDVAIKLLRPDLADVATLRHRFEREARAAARIAHPNVVTIHDTGEEHGVPYIVMERLPGRTLADELARGVLGTDRCRAVALEVLDALDAAHRLGIVHRDVKPANALLTVDGNVKVADFGIAQMVEDSHLTTTGVLLGTVTYLAPERVAGAPASPSSDLYSVGVLMFEALAGRPPFRAETPLGLVDAVAHEVPPRLDALREDVDGATAAVVARAMSKDPAERFESAAAMAAAVHDAAARSAPGDPAMAATVPVRAGGGTRPTAVLTSPPRPARPERRGRGWGRWAALAILLGVLLAGAVALVVSRSSGAPPRERAPVTTTTPGGPPVPAPLDRAIDDLDAAVRS